MILRLVLIVTLCSPAAAAADVFAFETPSGNIDCSVGIEADGADIHCTIYSRQDPPALPRPAECGTDWGHSFLMLSRGPVTMRCEPLGRNLGGYEVAPYGETGSWEGITCTSTRRGFECRNLDGHGFFLSRARQEVW